MTAPSKTPAARKAYRAANRDLMLAYERAYRAANRDAVNAASARHAARVNNIHQRRHALKQYGMTVEEYDALALAQGGVCAVCRQMNGRRRLTVDHDHTTGEVRGLLCHNCNVVLGLMGDDTLRLRLAADYLEGRHNVFGTS